MTRDQESLMEGATTPYVRHAVGGVGGSSPRTEGADDEPVEWRVEEGPKVNYTQLGSRLAVAGDLFRNGRTGAGLILARSNAETRLITRATDTAPVLADRVKIIVTKNGKFQGTHPSLMDLNAMLRAEAFLANFPPVVQIARHPMYRPDFTLVLPGYDPDDGLLYLGPEPEVADDITTITRFLDVMEFESAADRTNAVGAALIVRLRHLWPGAKPLVLVTATKSHAGKGTVTDFVRGPVPKADLQYQTSDWPLESQFHKQLKANPDVGVVLLDNVRIDTAGGGRRMIRSGFVESLVTTADITVASPTAGDPIGTANRFVVLLNTNDGYLSEDMMNRALPIRLAPKGDIHARVSPIGNPKLEFLPDNQHLIEAELHGMIRRWREAGCPPGEGVRHPMGPCMRAIAGILQVNGFADFLTNAGKCRTAHDPLREALGLLGAAWPDAALKPAEWATLAVQEGLAPYLFTAADRGTDRGRERGIGVVLSRHLKETFVVPTTEGTYRLRLIGGNGRWGTGDNPHMRYRFEVLEHQPLPEEV